MKRRDRIIHWTICLLCVPMGWFVAEMLRRGDVFAAVCFGVAFAGAAIAVFMASSMLRDLEETRRKLDEYLEALEKS